jgi:hypothetical protein
MIVRIINLIHQWFLFPSFQLMRNMFIFVDVIQHLLLLAILIVVVTEVIVSDVFDYYQLLSIPLHLFLFFSFICFILCVRLTRRWMGEMIYRIMRRSQILWLLSTMEFDRTTIIFKSISSLFEDLLEEY